MIIGYARVSTHEQDPTIQVEAIRKEYPEALVHEEQASASSRNGRPRLETILQTIREGDTLVVLKLDRLARNVLDLLQIVEELEAKKASLVILDQKIDTNTSAGRCFLQMLGVFAEFETNLRRERQMAGIAKAKAEGKYKGRPATANRDAIGEMLANGSSHASIAKILGVSTKTVQRVRREIESKDYEGSPMDH
ncbi:recombinase family protein [Salidesulfovibrio onnuriiensis]|uniref:recombinase family protein n=1 Tax=Salidesulfovibrio onnuriiensis TaxID=2583823 RepID=UPI001C9C7BE8|nr:recombinase family protein [Salidesulfovibrio onnuriiensis]